MGRGMKKVALYLVLAAAAVLLIHRLALRCGEYGGGSTSHHGTRGDGQPYYMVSPQGWVNGADGNEHHGYPYHRGMPLIFIGGVPRSGTTLMRAMLDAHPEVRCGQETRVIPRLLQMRTHWLKSQKESLRLEEAGLSKEVLDSAIAAFCLEVIARHGEPAPRLCNKDPLTLKSAVYLSELFPAAKFILMVRDGRATVHSIISRKVTITGFDLSSYRQCLAKWNAAVSAMHSQCLEVGPKRCLVVHYEQLVLHPRSSMSNILQFLEVPWNETVLHHEKLINKPGGVSLSKVERSSDQVIRPVNLDALAKWVGHIPEDVVKDMPHLAPMLSVLGYDPHANPPAYGAPDPIVADNTRRMRRDEGMWRGKAQDILGQVNGTIHEKVSQQNDKSDNIGEAPMPKDSD